MRHRLRPPTPTNEDLFVASRGPAARFGPSGREFYSQTFSIGRNAPAQDTAASVAIIFSSRVRGCAKNLSRGPVHTLFKIRGRIY